jgi:hypothetical protein
MTTSKPEHAHLPDELVDRCDRVVGGGGMTEVCSTCGGCGFLCYDCSDPQPWNTVWCDDCNPEWCNRPEPIYLWALP